MSYTFDADSGATRGRLVELVIANSFSPGRYTEFVRGWLDDAVTDVCRRLRIQRHMEILDFAADGTVAQPTAPYFHVEELWLADSNASGSGEQAVARYARQRLEPLPTKTPAGMNGTTPIFYTVRRQAFTARSPQPVITLVPARSAGKVAIVGLQRPAVMDDDADLSGLGADLDRALVAYAKARAYENEDDFDMSDRWEARYEAALRSVIQLPNQSDGPATTPGAWHEGMLPDGGR